MTRKIELTEILVGGVVTLMTAAIIAIFAKVYDMGEKQAVLVDQVQNLRNQVAAMDIVVTDERIHNAETRAMCERWIAKFKQKLGD